jgi:hypothetical protein
MATTEKPFEYVIMALNFVVPFRGIIFLIENYLREERISITYFFLAGLIGGLIATGVHFITKNKTLKVKIFATALICLIIVALNILANSNLLLK